ncbi:MAG: tyrosine-type recombinase/integrase [Ignavibacteria bacterium]|nr:tyrosine-type recombinase/integrase [Ignavibacteria bacterium]MBT8381791.1 tyrosine-type recombinase/integrase [Ignavibacteria bacterium]MBT8392617.1 tyrosine-type recombinase/integrase [Ignavibacteria bacterium]NNJ51624.1 tyrosine-type recombinase/integrase [Ignavibacteriaceae bacterium]NNL20298.1 tyrosine-type recombinase/integrase [Ignavibacteriaceae bacterium]
MKIVKAVENYLDFLENIKRYSINTLKSYRCDLNEFTQFCTENNKNGIERINERTIKNFLMHLSELKIEKSSITRKLSAVRGLFKYAFKEEWIAFNPSSLIRNPKTSKKLPEITSVENILKIYELAKEAEDQPILVIAIFELLYGCSLRVSELCDLKLSDLNVRERTLRILGKGNKVRVVPIGAKSLEIIKAYLSYNPTEDISSPLITLKNGKKLYPKYVYRIVNKYLGKVTDIKKKSPHILRHSSATHMLDRGADLRAVKEILGHENLRTTQIYTHVSIERLKEAYKKSHPKS